MKLDVSFSKTNRDFDMQFEENGQTFGVDYKDIQFVRGLNGENGKSAYELAVDNGFDGSEQEWLASLHGKDGIDGYTPVKNTDYFTDADKEELIDKLSETITEEWTFTLTDGSTVKKKVAIG